MSDTVFKALLGQTVVVDTRAANLAYIGRLTAVTADALVLADADVHDMNDSKTSREVYVMESKKYGVKANRAEVRILLCEVVSLSRLDDVIVY